MHRQLASVLSHDAAQARAGEAQAVQRRASANGAVAVGCRCSTVSDGYV